MSDPSPEVRVTARYLLVQLKHFGRYVMIEGLRKDDNPVVRAECVSGLAHFGLLSVRPVIISLTDSDQRVIQYARPDQSS